MSSGKDSRRLLLALYAYPREMRQAEGEVLTSLAKDMVEDGHSSLNREAAGLLRGGLVARAGGFADAPWDQALRRAGIPIATALLALTLGALAYRTQGLTWPGWGWVTTIAAPSLAIFGLLSGRRLPLMLGAVLICLLGVAQGNGLIPSVNLEGNLSWPTGGYTLPILACAIPAGLLLLAASVQTGRRASRSTILSTSAWVFAGAISVSLLFFLVGRLNFSEASVGNVTVDGPGICLIAFAVAAITAMAVGLVRRRRDPAGMLAGLLGVATILPMLLLYGLSRAPLSDTLTLSLFCTVGADGQLALHSAGAKHTRIETLVSVKRNSASSPNVLTPRPVPPCNSPASKDA